MKVAITGVTGNMGQETLAQLVAINDIESFRLLVHPDDKKRWNRLAKRLKEHKNRFEVVYGNLADKSACEKLVDGVDYVIGMAAVIPPLSDQRPELAIECNQVGVDRLVTAIENIKENQPKYIHISTVALYGNRNHRHPWIRVGDPLLVSPFDVYAASKLRGEFRVMEADIKNCTVIRQTAMLHKNMMSDNLSDGLMFHTCFSAPLEWSTATTSGILLANIIRKDIEEGLGDGFWGKCFNLGGGIDNCVIGFDTLNDGFTIICGSAKDYFEPNFNAVRNFHGGWFYDGDVLEKEFCYQTQTVADFWDEFARNHKIFKAGKIVPKALIKKFVIKHLFKSPNSPKYWLKHGDEPRMFAYFGGTDKYKALPKTWDDFGVINENRTADGEEVDYSELRNNKTQINHYFDMDGGTVTKQDLENVAAAHGGKLISDRFDGLYEKVEWENSDGERFFARPYTVLFGGHWLNRTYKENVWEFDRLAKSDKIYAEIWYDSHAEDEDKLYYMDEKFNAGMK